MKGLLKKDLLLIKSVALPMIAILVMLFVSGLVEYIDIIYVFILYSLVFLAMAFNQDRFHRTSEFIASIPDGKVKDIKAKYALSLLIIVALTLIVLAGVGINTLLHPEYSLTYVPIIILIIVSYTLLGHSIFLPLTYRFEIIKTSLFGGIWAIAGMFAILFALENQMIKLLERFEISKIYLGCGLMLFATLCLLYVSYIISIKVYLKKEK